MDKCPKWLQEIREREQAATPGPWIVDALGIGAIGAIDQSDGFAIAQAQQLVGDDKAQSKRKANTQFIAYARTDIPRLLDYIAAVEKKRDELKAALKCLVGNSNSCKRETHEGETVYAYEGVLAEDEHEQVQRAFDSTLQETTTN